MRIYIYIMILLFFACDDSGSPHQCLGQDSDADNDGICDGDDDCVGEYDCEGICINVGSTSSSVCYTFNDDILPIFNQYGCIGCHGSEGELNLSTYNSTIDGGSSGIGIVPNNISASIVWQRINDGSMPLGGSSVSSNEINIIELWINQGAPDE